MQNRFPTHIFHAHPLTRRLGSFRDAFKTIAEASNPRQRSKGFNDAAFWAGRTVADVLNSRKDEEGQSNIYHETLNAIFEAQEHKLSNGYGQLAPPSSHAITASLVGGPLLMILSGRYKLPTSAMLAIAGLAVSYWGLSQGGSDAK